MKEPKICLCRDTMLKLFKHLQKTKSGKTLWQLIAKRTANQFPMRKPRLMRKKPLKTMRIKRKKPRTAKQKAATRKLVAFNKRKFR